METGRTLKTADLEERVEEALREEEPGLAMRTLVRSLITEGHGRRELADALEGYRARLADTTREDDDDVVLDMIAILTGWASKTAVRNLLPPPCVAPHATRLD